MQILLCFILIPYNLRQFPHIFLQVRYGLSQLVFGILLILEPQLPKLWHLARQKHHELP